MSKKAVGGDYLLDLSSIEIEKSEDGTKTNITDADVLEQLTNLKKYVPNPQMAKPVWIKLKNGENDELVVARGTFANVGTGEFEICVLLNGYKLIISIKFTQALNEDDEPLDDWYIAENDAKYLFATDYKRVVVEDVKDIDDNILSTLQCGDVVIKHDESGEHAYVVSYRGETGICLTYADASVIETQSYDLTDDEWVYNSEDKSGNLIDDVKPVYCHPVYASFERDASVFITFTCLIFNNDATPFTKASFYDYVMALLNEYPDASIMASGYKNLLPISRIQKQSPDAPVLSVQTPTAQGTDNDYWTFAKNTFIDESTVFYDGVNKIN